MLSSSSFAYFIGLLSGGAPSWWNHADAWLLWLEKRHILLKHGKLQPRL